MHCRLPDGRIYWSPTIKKEKTLRKEDRANGWGTIGPFKWTVFVVNTKQSLPSLSPSLLDPTSYRAGPHTLSSLHDFFFSSVVDPTIFWYGDHKQFALIKPAAVREVKKILSCPHFPDRSTCTSLIRPIHGACSS